MWLKSEGFLDRVKGWWDSYSFRGSPSFVVASKLKALKMDLKTWNVEEFGSLDARQASLLATIKLLDELEDDRPLNESEGTQRDQAKTDFEKTMLMVEICWRQKSKALWLKEGDKNTKYFHQIANSHRRKNSIGQLAVNGEVFTDPSEISSRIVEFYKTLFTDVGVRRPTLDNLPCIQLDSNDAGSLDRVFTEEEVAEAV
jgi:hypothetical protein